MACRGTQPCHLDQLFPGNHKALWLLSVENPSGRPHDFLLGRFKAEDEVRIWSTLGNSAALTLN
jgi:hypothetical protein